MPTSRFIPTSPLRVETKHVSVMWCGPGIVVYKAVEHPDVFVCRFLRDKGRVDMFLERITGRAQGEVDRYIDSIIEPGISGAINRLSLRQAIRLLYRNGRAALREYVARRAGGGAAGKAVADAMTHGLPEDAAVERAARWLEEQLGPRAEQTLKDLAQRFKSALLFHVRRRLKANARQMLQDALSAACAAAFSVSVAMLLRWLWQNMARYFLEAVIKLAEAAAREIVKEIVTALLVLVLAVLAVVAIIFFLPEIVAAVAAAASALVAALGALLPDLIRLLPAVGRLVPGFG
jgi:hypothetical protein